MLKIRPEQMEEMSKVTLKTFEDDMVEHVKKFFPGYYDVLGEPIVRDVILYGVDRAEEYDLTTQRDVCLYINLMFLLGSNFDKDLQLPWIAEALGDETGTDPSARIDRLYDEAMEYLDEVAGVNNENLRKALLNIREVPFQDFSDSATRTVDHGKIAALKKVWPHKYEKIGESLFRRLVLHGIESAGGFGITTERGVGIFTGLMFMLGSGFDTDPQFPWAAEVLNDESITDQATRVDRLHKESMAFSEKWLD
jgi:hypothetical protein